MRTPRCYFCDMNRKTTNFIFVTERIEYGKFNAWDAKYKPGEILPAPGKYRDWSIPCAADMYYAHARAMAQFFAWSQEVRKGGLQMDLGFIDEGSVGFKLGVYNAVGPLSWTDRDKWLTEQLQNPQLAPAIAGSGFGQTVCEGFLQLGEQLIKEIAPHVFPKEYMEKSFLARFFKEARGMSYYVPEMSFYSQMMPEYFSLCHPNAQVDNAFYWRDDNGDMQAGLLDFGGIGHNAIPNCVANGWIGAEVDMMDEHEQKLTHFFIDEFEKASGNKLSFDEFYLHLKLAHGCVLFGCFANARWLKNIMKPEEWKSIKTRKDRKIDDIFLVRVYFVQVEMFLGMWKKRSAYPHWKNWMTRTGMPKRP